MKLFKPGDITDAIALSTFISMCVLCVTTFVVSDSWLWLKVFTLSFVSFPVILIIIAIKRNNERKNNDRDK